MTCLNNKMCGDKPHYYNEWCNYYSKNGYYYEEAELITCHRDNIKEIYPGCKDCWTGFVDCCADNRENCCKRSETSYPTSEPTAIPTTLCITNYYFQEDEKCNFLEIQSRDISYNNENSMICCLDDRSECCKFNYNILYGVLVIIIILLLSIAIFITRDMRVERINPETKLKKIIPI
jgi:hypothetical protein